MASQLYPTGKKKLLDADIDLLVDDMKVLGIDTADETYNAADDFHDDITGAGIVFTTGNLAGKSTTAGVFDANDITASGVTGDPIEALVGFKDTASSATSPLLWWMDISTFTPNGSDVTIVWNGSGIFAI